ncbi:hypothetical protein K5P26_04330 [Sphingopyxis sp. XHP0097]|uniref:Uncharacterized protein n=1 Tax=Sphingopyxis jiangsuensis TaxID=2871171 RepID=A0ABS7MBG5_9SPHN|nr:MULTISPECIES: hypothetical protein [Sphingopyxis]MBL0767903.1 hypothetical protein [Sphingopyxis lutea]MBY4636367.1 hypothetical protein [Sphingopyxis jiangsuensis]
MSQLAAFTSDDIRRVTFFKRDELTSDLICCEISCEERYWIFHEEMDKWHPLLALLGSLPNFAANWYERVSQPPFARSRFIAFDRPTP